ncbi:hypothetical protein NP233_g6150 [Leucocoprinus birnbaumii]|uniref:Uncharacterized protein n=1 Tax=Leucocoprinus birnbaumii TaxID=56174 RepID=A0AAD5VRN9_9AGAR|nr:hypothetical protein NP233_g6150 [Leucocoprinus birnbaumii]
MSLLRARRRWRIEYSSPASDLKLTLLENNPKIATYSIETSCDKDESFSHRTDSVPPGENLSYLSPSVPVRINSYDVMLPVTQRAASLNLTLSLAHKTIQPEKRYTHLASSPGPGSIPQEIEMSSLSDSEHMIRIKRLATRFCVYDCMFSNDGKLVNPVTNPQQCTPGTRTQCISDVASWVQDPRRAENICQVLGLDSSMILGSVYQVIKHSKLLPILCTPTKIGSNASTSRAIALIALAIATEEEELAELIETRTSDLEPNTLPDPPSLLHPVLTEFYSSDRTRRSIVVMLEAEALDSTPEVLQALMEGLMEYSIPVLSLLFSSWRPLPYCHYPFSTTSVPPLTFAEKEIILGGIEDLYSEDVQSWSVGDPFVVPVDVVHFCLADLWNNESKSEWKLEGPGLIAVAKFYLSSYQRLGWALNENHIRTSKRLSDQQYVPLISLTNNRDLRAEQLILVMGLLVKRTRPNWAGCTYTFFLNILGAFRHATQGFLELTKSDAFLSLFLEYEPNTEYTVYLRSEELMEYLEEKFHHLIQPVSDLALVPPLVFACLLTLGTRAIDRVFFAIKRCDFDVFPLRSSIVYLHQDIHRGLWKTLLAVIFWGDPEFLRHFASVLPRMQFHTHSIPVDDFLGFVFYYGNYEWPTGFVRVHRASPLDQDLIDACSSMARPVDLKNQSFKMFTAFLDKGEAGYVLLGFPTNPVLCIIVEEGVTLYTHAELADLI